MKKKQIFSPIISLFCLYAIFGMSCVNSSYSSSVVENDTIMCSCDSILQQCHDGKDLETEVYLKTLITKWSKTTDFDNDDISLLIDKKLFFCIANNLKTATRDDILNNRTLYGYYLVYSYFVDRIYEPQNLSKIDDDVDLKIRILKITEEVNMKLIITNPIDKQEFDKLVLVKFEEKSGLRK
jgi:hypothetical protein